MDLRRAGWQFATYLDDRGDFIVIVLYNPKGRAIAKCGYAKRYFQYERDGKIFLPDVEVKAEFAAHMMGIEDTRQYLAPARVALWSPSDVSRYGGSPFGIREIFEEQAPVIEVPDRELIVDQMEVSELLEVIKQKQKPNAKRLLLEANKKKVEAKIITIAA